MCTAAKEGNAHEFSAYVSRKPKSANKGFTLIEVITTAAIVSIGVALAVPSFTSVTEKR
jgi:prepilin-type N-terminal cleavage/methylation domain-containing protein